MRFTLMTLAVALAGATVVVATDLGGDATQPWPSIWAANDEVAGAVALAFVVAGLVSGGLARPLLGRKVLRFAVSRHQCWRLRRSG